MKRKFTIYNLQFTILIAAVIFFLNPTFAQTSSCGSSSTQRAQGLVTAPVLTTGSNFSTSGGCIIDPKAAFAPFKIPTYDDLKSIYYNQAKTISGITKHNTLSGNKTQADINLAAGSNHIYHIGGNLTLTGNITSGTTGVIFVGGNLTIGPIAGNTLTYGTANSGLVFVVKRDVNIDATITGIDAMIISEGAICTAYSGTTCPAANTLALQLVINGSLISLDPAKPIQFKRTLSDNSQPAEKINHQVKYLVILRNLLSDTYQKWSEIP